MKRILIKRQNNNPSSKYTIGKIIYGNSECFCIEKPWIESLITKNGRPLDSCIPSGIYNIDIRKTLDSERVYLINDKLDVGLPENSLVYSYLTTTGIAPVRGGLISIGETVSTDSTPRLYGSRRINDEIVRYIKENKINEVEVLWTIQ